MLIRFLLPAILCLFSLFSSGQSLEWAKKIGGSSNETGYKTAVDVNGNVYVTGNIVSSNIDFDPSAAVYNLSSAGGKDGFVAKYDQYGNFKWAFRFGGASHDDVNDIVVDHAGHILITGYFRGLVVDFDPSAATNVLNSNGQDGGDPGYGGDIFVAKYDTLGNYKWAFNVGGTHLGEAGVGISVDNSNNVLVTGYFSSLADFDPSPTGTATLNNSNGPLYVAKYNDQGQYQWAFCTGGVGIDNSGFDIVSDQLGNVIVTGYFQGSNIDFNPSPTASNTLSSAGGFDFFLAKYSPTGAYLWAFRAGGSGQDVGRAVMTDAHNDIYLTGDYSSSSIALNPAVPAYTHVLNGSNDAFIAKYSSAGSHLWSFDLGGNSSIGDLAWNMAKDAASNILITGRFAGSNVDFDPSTSTTLLSSSGDADAYVAKYMPTGQFICAFKVGGTAYDIGHGIGSYGNYVYVTGNFAGTADFDPGAGTSSLSSSGGDDAFFAKYNWSASPVSGTITGGTFCFGQEAYMTFNATGGTGPYSLTISDGTHFFTYNNVVSGVPFALSYSPLQTTTYTLTSIKDASPCSGNVAVSSTAVISTACGVEDCNNGIDDDGDGLTDCADPDCIGCTTPCGPVPRLSSKIFNTANNGAGVLPPNSMDRHWSVSYTLGGVPSNAYFSTIGCNPTGWAPSPYPDADWITYTQVFFCALTPQADSAHTYFSNSFQVPASLVSSLKIALDVSADNYIGEVYLNGVPQGIRHTSSDLFCTGCKISFTLNSGFVAGKNTLAILVLQQPTTTPTNPQSIGLLVNAKVIMDSDNDGVTDDLDLCPGTPPGVTVNATGCFDIDITSNMPLCANDSLVLESSFAGTGSIYQWTTPAGQVLTGKRIVIQNITAAQAGRYYLDITDAYNCVRKDSIDITLGQPPVVTVSPNTATCANTPVQLNASGGGTYRWFPATGLSDPNIANPIATITASTTYKVVVTGAGGCKDSALTTISMKEAPIMVSAGDGAICRGDSVQLNVSGGVFYQWFPSTGLSNANTGNPKASPSINTTYKVVVTAASGCKDSLNVTVTVSDLPTATVSPDAAVCPGDSVQLNAGGGASYEWSPAAGLSNAFISNPKASPPAPTTYTVTAISAMGCRSTATTTVSFHPKPTAVVVHPAGICAGDSTQLDASGGVSYQWIPAVGLSNANIADPKASPSVTTQYEVIVFNAQGCRDTAAALVSVKPMPVLSLGRDTSICAGGIASFDATLVQAASYLWSDGSTDPVLTTGVPGKYFVDVFIASCGKPLTDTVLVSVAQPPQVFLGEDTAACLLTPIVIRAGGTGATDYLWSTGSRESFITVTAEGIYTVTATNTCGTDSDDITVKMLPCSDDLYFPSAFTPNGNGRNDQFRPGYFTGVGITDYELRIYSRWGELIFVSTSLDKGWDGTHNGKPQQNNVFVWYAKYKKTTGKSVIHKKGTVVLIK